MRVFLLHLYAFGFLPLIEMGRKASAWRRQGWERIKPRLVPVLRLFEIDLRSLAVFRIGLGLAVMADALVQVGNARFFFSDEGFFPRALLFEHHWHADTCWSLHAWSGAFEWQVLLLVAQALAAAALTVGWRTRLVNFICWALVVSLEVRTPVIMNGADNITRLLLFWGLFLPLGARLSLDAWNARRWGEVLPASPERSIRSMALLLQVAFVYWFSLLCKTHECWWGQGTALAQTLQLDMFARPFGVWLRGHAELCRLLTYGWLVVEAVGPLLAFLPVWRTWARLAAVLLFVSFHLGIELCMDIGAFPWLMVTAWCAFVPGAAWDWLGRRMKAARPHPSAGLKARVSGRAKPQTAPAPEPSGLMNAFCAMCLVFVLMWNLRGTNFIFWERVFPRSLNPLAFALRLDQHWTMFAPRPQSDDGWFVLRAGMSDGSEVDLLRGGAAVDFSRPALPSAAYRDARWQKILCNLWSEEYRHLRESFGDALARDWNATHGGLNQVVAWQLWMMVKPILPDGGAGPVRPCLLFEREHFGGAGMPGPPAPLRASSP